jgi:carnitine 3-dehydrogenase
MAPPSQELEPPINPGRFSAGGIAHVLEHLGPPLESWWRDLGNVTLNEELNDTIALGVTDELGAADLAHLTSQRDDMLLALLRLKAGMTGSLTD